MIHCLSKSEEVDVRSDVSSNTTDPVRRDMLDVLVACCDTVRLVGGSQWRVCGREGVKGSHRLDDAMVVIQMCRKLHVAVGVTVLRERDTLLIDHIAADDGAQ